MKISKRKIELLQAKQGIGSLQLAERAGISRQNISTVIGRGSCRPETVGKLARALGVDPADIIEEED